ncbi:MAG: zinc-ribbon domain-containing protein [Candidatus Bathyarchaeota archaeon]|nr:zinc-ribbon domain-containing protein [Candidatus Bathyarchaeota archaeon]
MSYCPKCGAEIGEDTKFCPKCGTEIQATGVVYRRASPEWHIGRVFALIIGGFILLVAFGLVAGGGVLIWSQNAITDSQGFMVTSPAPFTVGSYAIVQSNININMGNEWMNPRMQDIVTLKLTGASNNGKPIFIGVGRQTDVQNYLNGVNVDKLLQYSWRYDPWTSDEGIPTYQTISGGAPSSPPTAQSFWIEQASGTGTQTMTWTPASGDYWIVVMNADGSNAVAVDMQLGARVTILNWIGWGLIIGGIIAGLIGFIIVYYGAIRRP